jgi:hypothetical protein
MRISQFQLSTLAARFLQRSGYATSWAEYSRDATYAGYAASERVFRADNSDRNGAVFFMHSAERAKFIACAGRMFYAGRFMPVSCGLIPVRAGQFSVDGEEILFFSKRRIICSLLMIASGSIIRETHSWATIKKICIRSRYLSR